MLTDDVLDVAETSPAWRGRPAQRSALAKLAKKPIEGRSAAAPPEAGAHELTAVVLSRVLPGLSLPRPERAAPPRARPIGYPAWNATWPSMWAIAAACATRRRPSGPRRSAPAPSVRSPRSLRPDRRRGRPRPASRCLESRRIAPVPGWRLGASGGRRRRHRRARGGRAERSRALILRLRRRAGPASRPPGASRSGSRPDQPVPHSARSACRRGRRSCAGQPRSALSLRHRGAAGSLLAC